MVCTNSCLFFQEMPAGFVCSTNIMTDGLVLSSHEELVSGGKYLRFGVK